MASDSDKASRISPIIHFNHLHHNWQSPGQGYFYSSAWTDQRTLPVATPTMKTEEETQKNREVLLWNCCNNILQLKVRPREECKLFLGGGVSARADFNKYWNVIITIMSLSRVPVVGNDDGDWGLAAGAPGRRRMHCVDGDGDIIL